MRRLGVGDFRAIIEKIADKMERCKDELCALDSRVGDGDLGLSLAAGFRAACQALGESQDHELAASIRRCANAILRAAPSSMGTLLALGMLAGARSVEGRHEFDAMDVARFLTTAVEAISAKGKAKPGDKTFLDAAYPAIGQISACALEGASICEALSLALEAARRGAELTRSMQARVGRAAWLRERTVGEVDPGARAVCLMFEAAVEALCQVPAEQKSDAVCGPL